MPKRLDDMTDEGRAAYYFEHRDDPEEVTDWERVESPLPKRKRGRPSHGYAVSYAVRFAPEEFQQLEAVATATGITGSELIRRAVAAYVKQEEEQLGSDRVATR